MVSLQSKCTDLEVLPKQLQPVIFRMALSRGIPADDCLALPSSGEAPRQQNICQNLWPYPAEVQCASSRNAEEPAFSRANDESSFLSPEEVKPLFLDTGRAANRRVEAVLANGPQWAPDHAQDMSAF